MSVVQAKSRVGVATKKLKRHNSAEAERELAIARRDLAAAKLEDYIEKVVAACPPLTAEQKTKLSQLLKGRR